MNREEERLNAILAHLRTGAPPEVIGLEDSEAIAMLLAQLDKAERRLDVMMRVNCYPLSPEEKAEVDKFSTGGDL